MTAFDNHAIAAPRPWFSFFDFFTRDREAELRSLLLAHGVTIIPTRLVEDHVRKMDCLGRPTIWHSILYMLAYVTAILSLRLPLHFLLRRHQVTVGILALVLAVFCVSILADVSPLFVLPLTVWGVETAVFLLLVLTEHKFGGKVLEEMFGAINRWHLYHPSALSDLPIPTNIQVRLSTLKEIPGVRPFILADTTDPFLVAVSGYGPFAVRCYVGAWHTGNPKLDDFR